ncbi:unnamed protein product [Protopolystoma xenopodis]|uniref:Uncharacterized protein n=1 Tax=Protopolystoma xenopodis TaxID=117903 RepID=A0A3S5CRR3_9PLAT|nr:unnamed protein product [Protopolystoma xenopodis]
MQRSLCIIHLIIFNIVNPFYGLSPSFTHLHQAFLSTVLSHCERLECEAQRYHTAQANLPLACGDIGHQHNPSPVERLLVPAMFRFLVALTYVRSPKRSLPSQVGSALAESGRDISDSKGQVTIDKSSSSIMVTGTLNVSGSLLGRPFASSRRPVSSLTQSCCLAKQNPASKIQPNSGPGRIISISQVSNIVFA